MEENRNESMAEGCGGDDAFARALSGGTETAEDTAAAPERSAPAAEHGAERESAHDAPAEAAAEEAVAAPAAEGTAADAAPPLPAADGAADEARRRDEAAEFLREYPEAARDPQGIPQEVWRAAAAGSRLSVAYARYVLAQARAELQRERSAREAAEQNGRNAARSTGSMHSAGERGRGQDAFLEGWES